MDASLLEHQRHTLAHLLAAATLKFDPSAKRTIGPAIDTGFYYDFEFSKPLSDEDLTGIESEMKKILPSWTSFSHTEVSADEARTLFKDNPYKLELVDEIVAKGETITLYTSGDFTDLCRGGHIENPSLIDLDSFKLDKLAGAYWRGDEKNAQLTRIYGLAFATADELASFIERREEAKKRDHRILGKQLGLFMISDDVGPGLPLFFPKGAILRRTVEDFITTLQERRGYQPIWIPHITKGKLYEISGHLDKYDAMYPPMHLTDEAQYYLKPMNCPHFMMLYREVPHSYRELPVRYVCTTTNYRYEKSGELAGLTRVRALTQDDCHVFMRPDQVESEIGRMLDMIDEVYKAFGFHDFYVRISTRDPKNAEKYIGSATVWEQSEAALAKLIAERGWKHEVGVGEAAFYGPKLDFIFNDVLGRPWQLSTIQLDMNLPERFELEYTGDDGAKHRPVVVHRAILGSTERFLGILIEHYGGAFPLWLAPVQVSVLPISDRHLERAEEIATELRSHGFRVEVNTDNDTIGKKIRASETMKVPYAIILGDKDIAAEAISVRKRGGEDLGQLKLEAFIEVLATEQRSKK
ncbi:MAG: threonine--tRNA ligase [Candidatus Pacebacteria bacterium]|nr:threonine--tRNA ligase [Candidatus Paceibacterota bacterium]